ncbi:hypothetical protein [Paraburkholderia sacchari]
MPRIAILDDYKNIALTVASSQDLPNRESWCAMQGTPKSGNFCCASRI